MTFDEDSAYALAKKDDSYAAALSVSASGAAYQRSGALEHSAASPSPHRFTVI